MMNVGTREWRSGVTTLRWLVVVGASMVADIPPLGPRPVPGVDWPGMIFGLGTHGPSSVCSIERRPSWSAGRTIDS
jgi:hypothetical protein